MKYSPRYNEMRQEKNHEKKAAKKKKPSEDAFLDDAEEWIDFLDDDLNILDEIDRDAARDLKFNRYDG